MHSVYKTTHGSVHQLDNENCFNLRYKENDYKLSVCAFIALKSKLDRINITDLILSNSIHTALEIVPLCNNDRILVLTFDEILELKELMAGSLVMLELNSILHQRVNRALV